MNKETELTLRLKGMGVYMPDEPIDTIWSDFHNCKLPWDGSRGLNADGGTVLWTIPSALAWLREKGYSGYLAWGTELSRIKTSKHDEIVVDLGHELEELLECMIKIVEGESK